MFQALLNWLFNPSGLTPHGFCLLWEPGMIWTYALSDIGIGIAYFTIPMALALIVQRRRDLVFRPIFWLFAAFILLCGTTHWLDVATLWIPAYGIEALVKALTAIVSIVTAILLWRLMPQMLTLPSAQQLRDANEALRERDAQLHQSRKMEAVGQLTGGIAHDFNNTLQGIAGALDLMERRIEQGRSQDTSRYSTIIRQALDRASSLTYRLMAFSRQQALQPRAVEPGALARGMEELIQRMLGPGIKLDLRLAHGNWQVLCDPNQLESALLNLAINARDAMQAGGTLTISTAQRQLTMEDVSDSDTALAGEFVEFCVADTGSGMTQDVLARAFEPFFTTKPPGRGTGLGLSQIYGFVSQSGGVVRIDSLPERGTKVRLLLPCAGVDVVAADLAIVGGEIAPVGSAAGLVGATVLVVDDEEGVRAGIVEALRDAGCTVLEAADGIEALRKIVDSPFLDMVVTDIGLPELNGRALAEEVRRLKPSLPVLLITGYAGAGDVNLGPGTEILHKPFSLHGLTDRVAALLNQSKAR